VSCHVEMETHSGHGVKRDRLEADEVVARRNGRGDLGGPGRVLRNHLARGPAAAVHSAREEPGVVDLEPRQAAGADASAARAGALGEVRELRAVRVGPN
jgi:hypothetical protein